MTPNFVDPAATRRWNSYFAEVDRLVARVSGDATELRGDLMMHVVDSMAAMTEGSELDRLDLALSRLGRPTDCLRPLLADDMIDRGTRSYSPVTLARGLFHSALAGSRRAVVPVVFGTGYLTIAIFAAMAVLKPLWGDHVGLFRHPDGTVSAGIVATPAGTRELLGWWSIPIALVLALLLYVGLTRGLRALRSRRTAPDRYAEHAF